MRETSQSLPQHNRNGTRTLIPPALPLAIGQFRHTWRFVLFIAFTVTLTTVIVCMAPLYIQVCEAAALRNTLLATPTSNLITTTISTNRISVSNYQDNNLLFPALFQQDIGSYLMGGIHRELRIDQISLAPINHTSNAVVNLVGTPSGDAVGHLQLLAGRFPQYTTNSFEIAISQAEAHDLGVGVGATLELSWAYYPSTVPPPETRYLPVPLTVVGIYATPPASGDPYWNASNLGESTITPTYLTHPATFVVMPFLTTTDALLSEIARLQALFLTPSGTPADYLATPLEVDESWHAALDPNAISVAHLDAAIAGINALTISVTDFTNVDDQVDSVTVITGDTIGSVGNPGILGVFRNRTAVSVVAPTFFAFQIAGVILVFVGLLMDLLIGRQTTLIALLRSRGAHRMTIFATFALQSLAICGSALLVGPLGAVFGVWLLARHTLAVSDWPTLRALQTHPVQTAASLGGYALLVVAAASIIMFVAIWQISQSDILALRRETARETTGGFWRRMRLELVFLLAAVVAFGLTSFVTSSGVVNTETSIELAPLVIVAPLCLALAVILFCLRYLPHLLQAAQSLAAKMQGLSAQIALTIAARAPRQVLRTTLLLALATALFLFTQAFIVSQQQRMYAVAAYESEADISGTIAITQQPGNLPPALTTLQQWTHAYQSLKGVQSASVGYSGVFMENLTNQQIELQAVDTATFAQTAIWPNNNGTLSLTRMMSALAAQEKAALKLDAVPAYVDASLWDTLQLQPGRYFTIPSFSNPAQGGFNFVAMGKITHLPPVADGIDVPSTNDYVSGGILMDVRTLQAVAAEAQQDQQQASVTLNTVWLKTTSSAQALQATRAGLKTGALRLADVHDRRAIIQALLNDPPYLAITQVLQLGVIAAFLLTLFGGLLSSWFDLQNRLMHFALLRALGATSNQIARIFLWEQGLTYTVAGVLGVALGLALSFTVIPTLVFTSGATLTGLSSVTDAEFYAIQRTPAVQTLIPLSAAWGLAVYGVICAIAIGLMTYWAIRLSVGAALRLNDD